MTPALSPQTAGKRQLVENVARQVFAAESNAILNGHWADSNMRLAAANKTRAAFQAVIKLLDDLEALVPIEATQPLLGPYIDAFQSLAGVLLRKAKGSDFRSAALAQATAQAQSGWTQIQDTVQQTAPENLNAKIREILIQVKDAVTHVHSLARALPATAITGARLIFDNKVKRIAATLPDPPPGGPTKEELAIERISKAAVGEAGGEEELGRTKIFGRVLLGLTVGIAVWDAIDQRTETTRAIVQNASGIALGLAVDAALEAPLEDAVSALVGAGLIGEASITSALAPTGIGILIGLGVSALVDLFFALFWTDVTFPPRLVVALTAPLTNDLHAQLTNPLLNVLTNDLTADLE